MKQRGFTLLEVLVATALMGLAVTTLLSQLSWSMRSVAKLTDEDRAVIMARQKMDELIIAKPTEPVALDGTWPPEVIGDRPAGWHAVIVPFEAPPQAPPTTPILEQIRLDVWWMRGEQRKTFHLEGYRQGVIALQVGAP